MMGDDSRFTLGGRAMHGHRLSQDAGCGRRVRWSESQWLYAAVSRLETLVTLIRSLPPFSQGTKTLEDSNLGRMAPSMKRWTPAGGIYRR